MAQMQNEGWMMFHELLGQNTINGRTIIMCLTSISTLNKEKHTDFYGAGSISYPPSKHGVNALKAH